LPPVTPSACTIARRSSSANGTIRPTPHSAGGTTLAIDGGELALAGSIKLARPGDIKLARSGGIKLACLGGIKLARSGGVEFALTGSVERSADARPPPFDEGGVTEGRCDLWSPRYVLCWAFMRRKRPGERPRRLAPP
jgi:hypothetical protein